MCELEHTVRTVEYKCRFYETAEKAGSVRAVQDMKDTDVPERFREIRKELRQGK